MTGSHTVNSSKTLNGIPYRVIIYFSICSAVLRYKRKYISVVSRVLHPT